MDEKSSIIDYAKKIGIDYIGFSKAKFSRGFIDLLEKARKDNRLSGFEESDELKRTDIESVLKHGKTFISIAIPYKYDRYRNKGPYFSRYTLGEDYHRVVTEKLNLLKNYIEEKWGNECRVFCDSGVLHDKEIARKSGIGFVGKNTNIITKHHGSYVFLGEILTTLIVESSKEIKSSCGSCNKCMVACPGNAIGDYGVDGKKCLSYISQKKKDLTLEEIDMLGTRIFGCDICQEVCPFNKGAENSTIEEFAPKDYLINIDINEILSMSNKDFKIKYGNHALAWRGKFIIQRNCIIAAGNSKNKEYLDILESRNYDIRLQKYIDISIKKLKDI